jgi:hypothetical protein
VDFPVSGSDGSEEDVDHLKKDVRLSAALTVGMVFEVEVTGGRNDVGGAWTIALGSRPVSGAVVGLALRSEVERGSELLSGMMVPGLTMIEMGWIRDYYGQSALTRKEVDLLEADLNDITGGQYPGDWTRRGSRVGGNRLVESLECVLKSNQVEPYSV